MNTESLKVHAFEARPLLWWKTQRAKIDMEPPYQRHGGIWSTADKAFLIDSILNDFDLPKFYIADFTFSKSKLNKKKLAYAIVDGKQRFEAMFDFFDGNLALDEDFVLLEDPSLRLGGLTYANLRKSHPHVADKYDSFNPTVMRILSDSEAAISELFVRLNRSKPLTGAEVRNAVAGPVSQAIRRIASHEFFESYIRFTNTRGQCRNAAAKVLYFEYHGRPMQTKKIDLDEFARPGVTQHKRVTAACRSVLDVLDELVDVFLPHDKLLASAGLIPDYYWFVRGTSTSERKFVREFLVQIDRRRSEFTASMTSGEVTVSDDAIAKFVESNRDTNDKAAHEQRIKILKHEFSKYTAKRDVSIFDFTTRREVI